MPVDLPVRKPWTHLNLAIRAGFYFSEDLPPTIPDARVAAPEHSSSVSTTTGKGSISAHAKRLPQRRLFCRNFIVLQRGGDVKPGLHNLCRHQ